MREGWVFKAIISQTSKNGVMIFYYTVLFIIAPSENKPNAHKLMNRYIKYVMLIEENTFVNKKGMKY